MSLIVEVKIRNTIHVKSSDKEVEVYRRTRFVVLCIVCLHIYNISEFLIHFNKYFFNNSSFIFHF
jgi:hypothetical protein